MSNQYPSQSRSTGVSAHITNTFPAPVHHQQHAEMHRQAAYAHSVHVAPQQYARSNNGIPSYTNIPQQLTQGQNMSDTRQILPQNQYHIQQPMLLRAHQQRHLVVPSSAPHSRHVQQPQPVIQKNMYANPTAVDPQPNHIVINANQSTQPLQPVPTYEASRKQAGGAETAIPVRPTPGQTESRPHPETNVLPPMQVSQSQIPGNVQSTPQDRLHPQNSQPFYLQPPPQQQSAQLNLPQQQPETTVAPQSQAQPSASDHQSQSTIIPVDLNFQLADRHASGILARTYPSLNAFYAVQRRVLRDELLNFNARCQLKIDKLEEGCRIAVKAAREAKEKQDSALQVSESIVQNAMKWKESLEDSRRKHAAALDQNAKLVQMALHMNKVMSADSSASKIAALSGRITFLEARLRKYEDVPLASMETNSLIINKEQLSSESTFTSRTVQDIPFSGGQTSVKVGTNGLEANPNRLKAGVNIVAGLVERRPKPGSPESPKEFVTIKEEPTAQEREKELLGAPYFIDLTVDRSSPNEDLEALVSSSVPISRDIAQFARNPISALGPGSETRQSMGSIHSSDAVAPFANPILSPHADNLKRTSGTEDDDDRQRKRPRPESDTLPQDTATVSVEVFPLREALQTQNDAEIASTGGVSVPNEPGQEVPIDDEGLRQLDLVHLQLIYHKYDTGVIDCRFCLMEMDNGSRDPDQGTVFPANPPKEELIAHATSCHRASVSYLLQLDRTDILAAFGKLMEGV